MTNLAMASRAAAAFAEFDDPPSNLVRHNPSKADIIAMFASPYNFESIHTQTIPASGDGSGWWQSTLFNIADGVKNLGPFTDNTGVQVNYDIRRGGRGAKTAVNAVASFTGPQDATQDMPFYTGMFSHFYCYSDDNGTGQPMEGVADITPAPGTSTSSSITGNTLTVGGSITGSFLIGSKLVHVGGGPDLITNTVIVDYGTGSGGAGTYIVNNYYSTPTSTGAINATNGSILNVSSVTSGSFPLGTIIPDQLTATASITGTTLTVTGSVSGNGVFGVGTKLFGAGVLTGQEITALGTGTGGVGTYTVSLANAATGSITIAGQCDSSSQIIRNLTGAGLTGTYLLNRDYTGNALTSRLIAAQYPTVDTTYSKGNMYGLAGFLSLEPANRAAGYPGAKHIATATHELDLNVKAGTSVGIKSILRLIKGGAGDGSDVVQGGAHDAMLTLTSDHWLNTGTRLGISFGCEDSYWPIAPDGTLIGISLPNSGLGITWPRVKYGIDFRNLDVAANGGVFASDNFLVDKDGAITAASFNGAILASTGINGAAIDNNAWDAWTPTITAGTGTFTTLGSVTAKWKAIGKTVFFWIRIPITTNGTAANSVIATLPFTAASDFIVTGRGSAISGKQLQGVVAASGTTIAIKNYDDSYPGATGETILISGVGVRA